MEFEEVRSVSVKEAIRIAKFMQAKKQAAAGFARDDGDLELAERLDKEFATLEMLIDIAERWKADAD